MCNFKCNLNKNSSTKTDDDIAINKKATTTVKRPKKIEKTAFNDEKSKFITR